MKILVTGAAGFIGFHLTKQLLDNGEDVVGIDSINTYYDPALKIARLTELGIASDKLESGVIKSRTYENFKFLRIDLTEYDKILKLFADSKFDVVINLAAQAGVRYALQNPQVYVDSNLNGFFNILECCKTYPVKHLIFASSSSVYGLNEEIPFSEHHSTDHPTSLYAATKKANEVLAHSYSHIHGIPTTGLRFFTVYGPWGRPDMALFKFTKNILEENEIEIFGHGEMYRDFTYVQDIVEAISRLVDKAPEKNIHWDAKKHDPATSSSPYRILNIGRGQPVKLQDFVDILEKKLNKKAIKKYVDIQPGEVVTTYADTSELEKLTGFKPIVNIEQGVSDFVDWYLNYYK